MGCSRGAWNQTSCSRIGYHPLTFSTVCPLAREQPILPHGGAAAGTVTYGDAWVWVGTRPPQRVGPPNPTSHQSSIAISVHTLLKRGPWIVQQHQYTVGQFPIPPGCCQMTFGVTAPNGPPVDELVFHPEYGNGS